MRCKCEDVKHMAQVRSHLSTAETANMVPVWPDVVAFFTCLSHSECTQALMILVLFTLPFRSSHPLPSDPPTLPPAHALQIRTPRRLHRCARSPWVNTTKTP